MVEPKPKAERRSRRLRPTFPAVDWMLLPNVLVYVTSWYGLLVGKFPFQVLSFAVGLGAICSAGLLRIELKEVIAEDYLPTDSPSIRERSVNAVFNAVDLDDPTILPNLIFEPMLEPAMRNETSLEPMLDPACKNCSVRRNGTLVEPALEPTCKNCSLTSRKRREVVAPDGFGRKMGESCRQNSLLIVAWQNASDPVGRRLNLVDRRMRMEIDRLEQLLYNTTAFLGFPDGSQVGYSYDGPMDTSVCTRQQNGQCGGFTLRILRQLFGIDDDTQLDAAFSSPEPSIGLTYPRFSSIDFSKFLSDVELTKNGYISRVGAIREVFCVNEYFFDRRRELKVWDAWERAFDRNLRQFRSDGFDVFWIAAYQRSGEQLELVTDMVPKIGLTFLALILWCCVGALMRDAVRSKPWAGLCGVVATFFACSSGFGLCLWLSNKFNPILLGVPLLVLAIGLDDMFIFLEAWSRTEPTLSVEERMMLTLRTGGTTVCITFLINLIDFVVGSYTPFPIINAISVFAIACMVFDFVFQMTIFCPCLAIFGYVEQKHRHSCCCCKTVPTRQLALSGGKSTGSNEPEPSSASLICCHGGYERLGSDEADKNAMQGRILEQLTGFLLKLPVRIISILIFFAYVAASLWSITQLEVGLRPERVYRGNSNMFQFVYQQTALFSSYADEVNVVIENEQNYSNPKVRRKLLDVVDKIHLSGYFWEGETKFWLVNFLHWSKNRNISLGHYSNNSQLLYLIRRVPNGFLDSDQNEQLTSNLQFIADLRLDPNATTIRRSRFHLRAKDMSSPARQLGMMTKLRAIIDSYKPDIRLYAYGENFLLYDQYLTTVSTTLYYCGMTLGATVVVALFLIPHPACLFWVSVFVTSILIGIVGMMRFWDISLDSVSLINLLIAISFCSDLIAHPIHVFLVSNVASRKNDGDVDFDPKEIRLLKTRALIEEVATAAVPACIGTTLSVLAMSTSDAYIFLTFFRVMFLAVVLAILHALIFVPAFLSFLGPTNPGIANITRGDEKNLTDQTNEIARKNVGKTTSQEELRRRIDRIYENVVVRRRARQNSPSPAPTSSSSYLNNRHSSAAGSHISYTEEDLQSFSAFIPGRNYEQATIV